MKTYDPTYARAVLLGAFLRSSSREQDFCSLPEGTLWRSGPHPTRWRKYLWWVSWGVHLPQVRAWVRSCSFGGARVKT